MKILAIESSALSASAALLDGEILRAEYFVNFKKTHSETLLPMIEEIVRMTETELAEIDAIAVSCGPGSFTGLRIGAATAKGIALSLNKKIIPVPTLAALAFNIYGSKKLISPIMDARREQVYNGIYRNDKKFETIKEQRALGILELIDELNENGEPVIFLGDGVPVYEEILKEKLKCEFGFAPPNLNRQRASAVASLGEELFKNGQFVSSENFTLEYLRKSQAEREREEGKLK